MLRFFTVLMLLLPCLCGCWPERGHPSAARGVLDLSAWDLEQDGIAHLNGEWEFFWGRLLTPENFAAGKAPPRTGWFSFPDYWNGQQVNGRRLDGQGYATFRLTVKLKPGGKPLTLRIEDESSAYRLWVNGAPLMQDGMVAPAASAMQPGRTIAMADLPAGVQNLDCVLQVSNYHLFKGGPYRSISLGTRGIVTQRHRTFYAVDLIIMGILFTFGVYHLFLYLLRRDDKPLLYFGLFCLSWCFGIPFGSLSGRFITLLFPDTPWYWLSRMELLTWYLSVPLFLMFFSALFPLEFSQKVTRLVQVITAANVAFVLIAPSRLVNLTENYYSALCAMLSMYVIWRLSHAVRRDKNNAGLMLAGFIFFVTATINDILFMSQIIKSVYLTTVGVTVMTLFQSLAMARRYAQAFVTVESLSGELERKNVALTRLDRLKDEFLANTSHELRTPLNGIIGIADSLQSGIAGNLPVKARENLAMIVTSGKRLAGLIGDILDLTRLRNRDIRLALRPVDMRTLTDMVLTVMRPLANGNGLGLINDIPRGLTPVLGDENRLQQILYNLLGNAVKFTDTGEIRVSAVELGMWIEVAVSDTGIGVPTDKQASIFESFEQADASDTRSYGGAGLGLSITRQLVELHGGTITVTSTPGQGSTFRFTLPASAQKPAQLFLSASPEVAVLEAEQTDQVEMDAPLAELPDIGAPATILAVDDDPINLRVVANFLTYKNMQVITAASGQQTIALIEQGLRPDLVLLDIMMPHMTGHELLLRLRQRFTASELPAIMLTAKTGTSDMVKGFAHGANDYLVKPFTREELLARVVAQLKLARSYVTLRENLALRHELEERKHVERGLRVMQQSLSGMLDRVDEALLAVNGADEITFCNRNCTELLGYTSQALLGKPIAQLLDEAPAAPLYELLQTALPQDSAVGHHDWGDKVFCRLDGSPCAARVLIAPLKVAEDQLYLLILKAKSDQAAAGSLPGAVEPSLLLIETINRNRERLHSIRATLDGLAPLLNGQCREFLQELDAVDAALHQVGQTIRSDEVFETQSHLAVEVMCCALDCWTESTGLTKAELARQSGVWKVYTNQDGWERTQTLDRYLNLKTFPNKPNWTNVMHTAQFVLASGNTSAPQHSRLEMLLARLRLSYFNEI